jgi:hypothetical protein
VFVDKDVVTGGGAVIGGGRATMLLTMSVNTGQSRRQRRQRYVAPSDLDEMTHHGGHKQ